MEDDDLFGSIGEQLLTPSSSQRGQPRGQQQMPPPQHSGSRSHTQDSRGGYHSSQDNRSGYQSHQSHQYQGHQYSNYNQYPDQQQHYQNRNQWYASHGNYSANDQPSASQGHYGHSRSSQHSQSEGHYTNGRHSAEPPTQARIQRSNDAKIVEGGYLSRHMWMFVLYFAQRYVKDRNAMSELSEDNRAASNSSLKKALKIKLDQKIGKETADKIVRHVLNMYEKSFRKAVEKSLSREDKERVEKIVRGQPAIYFENLLSNEGGRWHDLFAETYKILKTVASQTARQSQASQNTNALQSTGKVNPYPQVPSNQQQPAGITSKPMVPVSGTMPSVPSGLSLQSNVQQSQVTPPPSISQMSSGGKPSTPQIGSHVLPNPSVSSLPPAASMPATAAPKIARQGSSKLDAKFPVPSMPAQSSIGLSQTGQPGVVSSQPSAVPQMANQGMYISSSYVGPPGAYSAAMSHPSVGMGGGVVPTSAQMVPTTGAGPVAGKTMTKPKKTTNAKKPDDKDKKKPEAAKKAKDTRKKEDKSPKPDARMKAEQKTVDVKKSVGETKKKPPATKSSGVGSSTKLTRTQSFLKLSDIPPPERMSCALVQPRVEKCIANGIESAFVSKSSSQPRPLINQECTAYLSSALNTLIEETLYSLVGLARHRVEGEEKRKPVSPAASETLAQKVEILKRSHEVKSELRNRERDLELLIEAMNEKNDKGEKETIKRNKKQETNADASRKRNLLKEERNQSGSVEKRMKMEKKSLWSEFSSKEDIRQAKKAMLDSEPKSSTQEDRWEHMVAQIAPASKGTSVMVNSSDMETLMSDFPSDVLMAWTKVIGST